MSSVAGFSPAHIPCSYNFLLRLIIFREFLVLFEPPIFYDYQKLERYMDLRILNNRLFEMDQLFAQVNLSNEKEKI